MWQTRLFKFPRVVPVMFARSHFPSRPINPGSIVRTRRLGTVSVKSHTRHIGF